MIRQWFAGSLVETMALSVLLTFQLASGCTNDGELGMAQSDDSQHELTRLILAQQTIAAETLIRQMGQSAAPVLTFLSANDNDDVRELVYELAGLVPGTDTCRVLLGGLGDDNPDLQAMAAYQLQVCNEPELAAEATAILENLDDDEMRGHLIMAIGRIGAAEQADVLRKIAIDTDKESSVQRDILLALARLGDARSREEIVRRLTDGMPGERFQALEDTIYIADPDLMRHFGPALDDYSPAVLLSSPEPDEDNPDDPEDEQHARICDFAVLTMMRHNATLSFEMVEIEILGEEQLQEAREYVRNQ